MMKRQKHKPRRGLIVVAVLVCLVVMMLLGAALLKVVLMERESNRDSERRLQAEWLVESGLERARARLAADANYSGETWALSAAELGRTESTSSNTKTSDDRGTAVVTISVDRSGSSKKPRVRVQADYPRGARTPSRHSEERLVDLAAQKTGAKP